MVSFSGMLKKHTDTWSILQHHVCVRPGLVFFYIYTLTKATYGKGLSTEANIKIQLSFIKDIKEILKKCQAIPFSLPIAFHFGKCSF